MITRRTLLQRSAQLALGAGTGIAIGAKVGWAHPKMESAQHGCHMGSPAPPHKGVETCGYWRDHPESWPVSAVTIGGKNYTKSQAISIMKTNSTWDMTYVMFSALVTTKLNILAGAKSTCIASTMGASDEWMKNHPVGSKVKVTSSAWKGSEHGDSLFATLDSYNNGKMCAPSESGDSHHSDDEEDGHGDDSGSDDCDDDEGGGDGDDDDDGGGHGGDGDDDDHGGHGGDGGDDHGGHDSHHGGGDHGEDHEGGDHKGH